MKRRFSTMLAVLVVLALVMGIAAITTTAANTPVAGGTVNFTKYMVVPQDAYIPNVECTFSIAAGTAVAADSAHMAVYAGPTVASPAAPTVGTATFTSADTTYTSVQTGDDLTLLATEKYAKKTVAIDLSGVSFTEPGVYRYELTENNPVVQAVGKDTRTLYLDVYVTSDAAGVLTVSSTVLHTDPTAPLKNATSGSGDVVSAGVAVADKTTGFVNHYPTGTITFSKAVSGNQASRDKYFAFTVTFIGLNAGDEYDVDYTNADASIAASPNAATTIAALSSAVTQPAKLTVPAGATSVTQVFYLHDGQSISVKGLPIGAGYTVLEDEEDYTPAVAVTGDVDASSADESVKTDNHQAEGTLDADDANEIVVAFTNTRDGIIPTGVIMAIAPFAIGLCLFGAVIIFIISKKRRQEYC